MASPNGNIEHIVRESWGRILAALIRQTGDFGLAEDSLQDAVEAALKSWPDKGIPESPEGWLLSVAKRKAVDRVRRAKTASDKAPELRINGAENGDEPATIPDKRLELIFTCCHPALPDKTRVALTLRTICGLSVDEIARAFLDKPATVAQRLSRARQKIKAAGIPYRVPDAEHMKARLSGVLAVIYLIFNEGYSASSGEGLTRAALVEEALFLARMVKKLLPEEGEVDGLLALMLLHDARRPARLDERGAMIRLQDQDRRLWDAAKITEGKALVDAAFKAGKSGPYLVQAAISALHAAAPSWDATDWFQITGLYALLYRLSPNPVILVNKAVAVSYAGTAEDGLRMLGGMARDDRLNAYAPLFAARADMLARLGRNAEAAADYDRAIKANENRIEREFLQRQRAALSLPEA